MLGTRSPLTFLVTFIAMACLAYIAVHATTDVLAAAAGFAVSNVLLAVGWANQYRKDSSAIN